MGKAVVVKPVAEGGPQIYTTEDFALEDSTSMSVVLPEGHKFSDFSYLAIHVYANPAWIVCVKMSDNTITGGGYGGSSATYLHNYSIPPDTTVIQISGITSKYGNELRQAFGILK